MFAKYDCSVGTLDIAPPHTLSVIVICVDGVDDHNNDDAADDDDKNDRRNSGGTLRQKFNLTDI